MSTTTQAKKTKKPSTGTTEIDSGKFQSAISLLKQRAFTPIGLAGILRVTKRTAYRYIETIEKAPPNGLRLGNEKIRDNEHGMPTVAYRLVRNRARKASA